MTIHRDLLQQARRLAQLDPMRPRQANLRRAVSSAYYAVFHYLADQACRMMMGAQLAEAPFRHVIARGFDHGTMRMRAEASRPQICLPQSPAGFLRRWSYRQT